MPETTMRGGDPQMIDYTPTSGDVSAGQVILIGNTAGLANVIAHTDISNNTLGAVSAGGGIYDMVVLGNYARGTAVYWDDTNNKCTSTSTNMSKIGYTLEAAAAANATVKVLHHPFY